MQSSTLFFSQWTSDSAYVLGYWFADGNMYTQASAGSYIVSFASKDFSHLEMLQSKIGIGRLTRISKSDVFKLVICRKEMYEDLLLLGGTERKSLTLKWPYVPLEHVAHLTRGYIDGDGSLSWHRTGMSIQPLLEIAGTHAFLTGITHDIYRQTEIPVPSIHQGRRVYVVRWYGIAAKCLAIWLYQQNTGLAMERKAMLAREFGLWQPKVFRKQNVTPGMWRLFGEQLP